MENKQDLQKYLSESRIHTFTAKGPASYSVFNLEHTRAEEINKILWKTANDFLVQELEAGRDIDALGLVEACIKGIELNGDAEILHFVFNCGNIYRTVIDYITKANDAGLPVTIIIQNDLPKKEEIFEPSVFEADRTYMCTEDINIENGPKFTFLTSYTTDHKGAFIDDNGHGLIFSTKNWLDKFQIL